MPKIGDSSHYNLHDFMRLWTVLRTGLRRLLLELLELVHESTKFIEDDGLGNRVIEAKHVEVIAYDLHCRCEQHD